MWKQPMDIDRAYDNSADGVTAISIRGFKSHAVENRIDVRPFTILAGANSSGKSSIMQPLLLMKQTLEASYDPGPLLLNGPNVRFTAVDQLLSRFFPQDNDPSFAVGIDTRGARNLRMEYAYSSNRDLEIRSMSIGGAGSERDPLIRLTPNDESADLKERLSAFLAAMELESLWGYEGYKLEAIRDRCFLTVAFRVAADGASGVTYAHLPVVGGFVPHFELIRMIHVSGSRGSPERTYSRTTANTIPSADTQGPRHLQLFPGMFEKYAASVIFGWQSSGDSRLDELQRMLQELGLGRDLSAERVDDTQIELRVRPLFDARSHGSRSISIADVGFGVSQVLPVLVALLVAVPGQLVYVEQPELHLHPRVQCALASIMADTARRGVRLIVETHSALLLLSVRTLVAGGRLDSDAVKLHWFALSPGDGSSTVSSADLDPDGAYGNWPEDFGDVELVAEGQYLDTVEQRNGI